MSLIFREIVIGLKKPRSGWVIRDIPEEVAETILQHVSKVKKAARIYGQVVSGVNQKKLVNMAQGHDLAEYKEKDYLPNEITKEEKFLREREPLLKIGYSDFLVNLMRRTHFGSNLKKERLLKPLQHDSWILWMHEFRLSNIYEKATIKYMTLFLGHRKSSQILF